MYQSFIECNVLIKVVLDVRRTVHLIVLNDLAVSNVRPYCFEGLTKFVKNVRVRRYRSLSLAKQ